MARSITPPRNRKGKDAMSDMTLEQKALLEPFANLFAGMDNAVREMTDEQLKAALAACCAASTTNCWCFTFHAAQHLQREIRTEINQRGQRTKAAAQVA